MQLMAVKVYCSEIIRIIIIMICVIIGEQMIGYGPDISTDEKNGGNKQYGEDADFHPLPPPITKGTVITITTMDRRWL